jgi:hypothetical protein
MFYLLLADLVLIFHALFVVFVVLGGFVVLRWRKVIWIHAPCVAWGVILEFQGWICPLTYLENDLLVAGGATRYTGDFIWHYLRPLVYPPGITADNQFLLGVIALVINLIAYTFVWRCWRQQKRDQNQ